MTMHSKATIPALGSLLVVFTIIILLVHQNKQVVAGDVRSIDAGAPNCRAGVSTFGPEQVGWVDDVGAGLYVYFGGYEGPAANGAEILPVISVKQDKLADGTYLDTYTLTPSLNGLKPLLAYYPGILWIVGNEVDRGPDPGQTWSGQGDTFPDVYARAYHEVYHFIKKQDPTAQVANAGLVQVTPGRLQYLDLVWQAYLEQFGKPMPVDVWNMHIYILPEAELDGRPNGIANVALGTNPALARRGPGMDSSQCTAAADDIYCYAEHDNMSIFDQQVRAMRQWMFDHGQSHKPLILTEFSILYPYFVFEDGSCEFLRDEFGNCFDPDRVRNYLNATTSYLRNATDGRLGNPMDKFRLVQQWVWFSINNSPGVGDVSDLVARSHDSGPLTGLTSIGQRFKTIVLQLPDYVNLMPGTVPPVAAETAVPGGTVGVRLQATIGNNGSLPVDKPFRVTFYSDSKLSQVIGHSEVPAAGPGEPDLTGCARRAIQVSTTWKQLKTGLHRFWIKIDSLNQIEEGSPPDWKGEQDNVASSFVLVNPRQILLPMVGR